MNRRVGDRLYNRAFAWAERLGACSTRDTIVIVGAPRSGTTFVLEVLHKIDGYKALNEPLQVRYAADHGFSRRTFLTPSQQAPTLEAYLQKVCTGQLGPAAPWLFEVTTRRGHLVELAARRKLVVKFCRLNRMLHWFIHAFDVRGIVYVIRHPCAAVSSMLKHGAWTRALERKEVEGFPLDLSALPNGLHERFRPIVDRIDTLEEAVATMWCLDNYLPLVHYDAHPWIMVPYERLVTRGVEELGRIAGALGVRVNDDMVEGLIQPSISAKGQLKKDPDVQLSKWKDYLTARQVERVMQIVDEVGLSSLYGNEPEPYYAKLNELQDPRWRWS